MRVLIVIMALIYSQVSYSDTVKSRFPELEAICDFSACTYHFGAEDYGSNAKLSFAIRHVGKPFSSVAVFNATHHMNGYSMSVDMDSGCVAVSRSIKVGNTALGDNLFVSTRTGKTYLDHKQCSED